MRLLEKLCIEVWWFMANEAVENLGKLGGSREPLRSVVCFFSRHNSAAGDVRLFTLSTGDDLIIF